MSLNDKIDKIKKYISVEIDNDLLERIIFEMNRFFDKKFTTYVQDYQKKNNRVFNQKERNTLRKYYYYGNKKFLDELKLDSFASICYTKSDLEYVLDDFLERCERYDKEKIISSLLQRKKNIEMKSLVDNSSRWLDYYSKKRNSEFKFSVFVLNITQNDFSANNYSIDYYTKIISSIYDELENYRHLIVKVNGVIKDKLDIDVTWKMLYKIGIFVENFVQYKGYYSPFKKNKCIDNLTIFLNERFPNNDNYSIASKFYSSISTGFMFEDCFISEGQEQIVLTYKKIHLDERPIPCPSCMTTIQSGNSYPELFIRSYECKNPFCPERSKSGRGKRFDEFGVYRYFKLVEDSKENIISYSLYDKWRRDIFSNQNDVYEMIYKYYAWENEKICIYGDKTESKYGRIAIPFSFKNNSIYLNSFNDLPIVNLFKTVCGLIPRKNGNIKLEKTIELFNDDSSVGLRRLEKSQVGAAITSPPYYNAREYSQWQTLIMYLIDMMINGSAVFDSLKDGGYYLYNIGDIVNRDNVYVESNMSRRRLQLGFLSCLFFEILGFNLEGNIIWDKGQVQSKRNSTVNLNSGYVKCINCYEHVLVFKKGDLARNNHTSYNIYFSPVIKINSKGENTYKHTAPFPPEMVELVRQFAKKDLYILDPYLGSGTTLKWCLNNGFKGLGYELNKDYFELSKKRIFNL